MFVRPMLSLLAVLVLAMPLAADEVRPLKALMVTGGCCHDYEAQKKILSEGISARARVEWTIVHQGGKDRNSKIALYEDPNWADGYDVVVHNECFGGVTDVEYVERIAFAHRSVPAVMLHCSAHSYRNAKTDAWRQAVGISSYSHEKQRPLTVVTLEKEHPILQGFPDNWKTPSDELYKSEKLWPNTVPLAKAYGEDTQKDHYLIWTNTYHGQRVFGTTLGHGNATMESDVYLDLVTRGLLWATGKLDDQGRPVAGYGAP